MKKWFLFNLAGFAFLGLFFPNFGLAEVAIGISPVVFEMSGNPGDIIENQVKVVNSSQSSIGIKMTVEDIAPTGEAGFVTVEPAETETYSVSNWIKIDKDNLVLESGEEEWVSFVITIPENAEPGGHYGTIIAGGNMVSGENITGTGTGIIPRVGTLVLVTVSGEMKENLIVKDFTVPIYSEQGPINFDIRFENKGTIHVKPKTQITITNWLGRKVIDIYLPEKNVLPGAIRKFEASWNVHWLFGGKYTATLTGNYGASNSFLTPIVITFWVFPWKIGIVILIVLLFIVLARKRLFMALRIIIKGR